MQGGSDGGRGWRKFETARSNFLCAPQMFGTPRSKLVGPCQCLEWPVSNFFAAPAVFGTHCSKFLFVPTRLAIACSMQLLPFCWSSINHYTVDGRLEEKHVAEIPLPCPLSPCLGLHFSTSLVPVLLNVDTQQSNICYHDISQRNQWHAWRTPCDPCHVNHATFRRTFQAAKKCRESVVLNMPIYNS